MPVEVGAINGSSPKQSVSAAPGAMAKDTFLKILVAQLSHPDPFAPQDPGAFVTEMAQIALLEQLLNLSARMESLYRVEALSQAAGVIGREVVVANGSEVVTGTVEKVVVDREKVCLVIGGNRYDVANLVEVR
uniref:Flagellar hook capping protein n=1 Tax=Ammonifex degensii TaxID=42838 RepID=A0A7C1JJI6_9THEO